MLRCGDLRSDFMGAARAEEGLRAHQRLQRQRPEGYEAEYPVRLEVTQPDFTLCIGGRIDGVLRSGDQVMVEEIKSTLRPLPEMEAGASPVHWGQALCYAYMLARQEQVNQVAVQLTYVHLESGKVLTLVRQQNLAELTEFFDDLLARYLQWLRRLSLWINARDRSLASLPFPFDGYRPGQREMAVEVFRTIRDGRQLLVQAATGIGKTMAALYPALKALGQRFVPKVVFLTARTTGRLAAEAALRALAQRGMRLKWVTVTAKEKICFNTEPTCSPDLCPYARGHYDRLNLALEAIFEQDAFDREAVERTAREHQVCPFEFSLELVLWADCVIGDYNYAFDPTASLKRLFGDEAGGHAILVDEAHNLADRSREMFSAQLTKA
ncbi:MAG: PD-(D/E)XK nuclease family protein, partial [Desulfobacterales bacterium]|nr:PD-(D/E)XK nuclease family protein [Desulfobacterales bacterium]